MNAKENLNAAQELLRRAAAIDIELHPRAQLAAKVLAARASAHATLAGVLAANPDLDAYADQQAGRRP